MAAFDGRLPGNTTDLGAMAASWPPWHAHCLDASANSKGLVWRGCSNTHVLHSMLYRPCRSGQTVLGDCSGGQLSSVLSR
jgi:hypothetical protein